MKAKITFEIQAPQDCSEKQFVEWLKMELGVVPHSRFHPLFHHNLSGKTKNLKIQIKQ